MAQPSNPGQAPIDMDQVNRTPTPEEVAAYEEQKKRAARNPITPGAPGQLAIDPVVAGWQKADSEVGQQYADSRSAAIVDYNKAKFGYSPYQTQSGDQLKAMNWNPYQKAASNQAASQAGSQYQSLMSGLQGSGGVSTADRMNSFQNFNRQKIMGQLGAGAKYDQAQSQSNLESGMFNSNRAAEANRMNVNALNDQSRMKAGQNMSRTENLYNSAVKERDLQRQLEAAKYISKNQTGGSGSNGFLDQIFNSLSKPFE